MKDMNELRGVSGWLAFFVVALCALGPMFEFNRNFMDYQQIESSNPELLSTAAWVSYKQYAWAVFSSTVLLRWAAGFALTNRFVWSSVKFTIAVGLSVPVISSVGRYLAMSATFGPEAAARATETLSVQCIQGLFVMGVWSLYLLKSRRVRNTYPVAPTVVAP
ncbi:MAG: DUF2569 family protein [Lysobacterales bacterium]